MEHGLSRSSENRNRMPRSFFMSNSKKNQIKSNRLLISVTVMGSAGPIRLLVNADEMVTSVIEQTLKSYVLEGRRPILGRTSTISFSTVQMVYQMHYAPKKQLDHMAGGTSYSVRSRELIFTMPKFL